jgi:hypothetical protein
MNWAQPTINGAMMWERDDDIEALVNFASIAARPNLSCEPGTHVR